MSDVQPEKGELVITEGKPYKSQFGPTRKVVLIMCGWCDFYYERENLQDARWFAQMHNEEVHSLGLEIIDKTKTQGDND